MNAAAAAPPRRCKRAHHTGSSSSPCGKRSFVPGARQTAPVNPPAIPIEAYDAAPPDVVLAGCQEGGRNIGRRDEAYQLLKSWVVREATNLQGGRDKACCACTDDSFPLPIDQLTGNVPTVSQARSSAITLTFLLSNTLLSSSASCSTGRSLAACSITVALMALPGFAAGVPTSRRSKSSLLPPAYPPKGLEVVPGSRLLRPPRSSCEEGRLAQVAVCT